MASDPYWHDDDVALYQGDAAHVMLNDLPHDTRVQCIVTSPPYFNLRDYGLAGQIRRITTTVPKFARSNPSNP